MERETRAAEARRDAEDEGEAQEQITTISTRRDAQQELSAEEIIECALAKARKRDQKRGERHSLLQGPTLSQLRWRKSILHCRVASAFALAGERGRSRRLCHAWRVALYRVVAVNHFLKILQAKRGARHRWRTAVNTLVAVQRFSKAPVEGRKFRAELKRCGLRVWSNRDGHTASEPDGAQVGKLSVVTSRHHATAHATAQRAKQRRRRKRTLPGQDARALAETQHRASERLDGSVVASAKDGDEDAGDEASDDPMTDSEDGGLDFDELHSDHSGAPPLTNGTPSPRRLEKRRSTCGSETDSDEDEVIYSMDSAHELWSMGNDVFERKWQSLSFHSVHETALAQAAAPQDPARSIAKEGCSSSSLPTPLKRQTTGEAAGAAPASVTEEASEHDSVSPKGADGLSLAPRAEDFEPLRIVGTGGSGQVYLVQHKRSFKRFAMKVLNKAEVVTTNKIERVITEREILTRSQDSPFITALKFAFHSDNMLFFVMEYCAGGNLHEAMLREHEIRKPTLNKERYRLAMDAAAEGQGLIGALAFIQYFDRPQCRRRAPRDVLLQFGLHPVHAQFIVAEIIEGLLFLHRAGFVYRDLKPQNVMLNVDGHVRIGDFGISKAGTSISDVVVDLRSTSFVGTVEYMAPEVVSGEVQSSAVDLWGVGILMYELLYGSPPFWALATGSHAESELEQRRLFAAILRPREHLTFPLAAHAPVEARSLIESFLCRAPHERLSLEAAKKHAYFQTMNWRSLNNSSGFHKLVPRLHLHRHDRKAASLPRSTSNNIFVASAASASDILGSPVGLARESSLGLPGANVRRKSLSALRKNSGTGVGTSDRSLGTHRRSLSGRMTLLRGRSQGSISAPSSPLHSEGEDADEARHAYTGEASAATAPLSMLPPLDVHLSSLGAPRTSGALSIASEASTASTGSGTTLASGSVLATASAATAGGVGEFYYGAGPGSDELRHRSSSATTVSDTVVNRLSLGRSSSRSPWGRMKGWMRSISGNKASALERAASEPVAEAVAARYCGHTHSDVDDAQAIKIRASGFHSGRTTEFRKQKALSESDGHDSELPDARSRGDGDVDDGIALSAAASFVDFDWKADLA